MAKVYVTIGYSDQTETSPGVWSNEPVTERTYCGDLGRSTHRLESSDNLNDDINIDNELSIVADPFAYQNFHTIKYAEFNGTKWKVRSVEVQYPRLRLMIGGLYNG